MHAISGLLFCADLCERAPQEATLKPGNRNPQIKENMAAKSELTHNLTR